MIKPSINAISVFVKIFLKTLLTTPFSLSIANVREQAFASLWKIIVSRTLPDSPLFPFLAIQKTASGLVLDLGPGTGAQLEHFDPARVTKIYGAEPSASLHDILYKEVSKQGLDGKYKVLNCGAEWESIIPALTSEGLIPDGVTTEIFDTIVCSKVLCGVPRQEDTVKGLYKLLKPGGRLLINEHIRNRCETPNGSYLARAQQWFFTVIGWQFMMGGCVLDRDTAAVIERLGEWEDRRLNFVIEWSTIPFVFGWFEKKN